jgi:hypothetical protein
MDSLQQQPRPTESAKEEALKQYIENLQHAKLTLNILTSDYKLVSDEDMVLTVGLLKSALIDAAAYIKEGDEDDYRWLLSQILRPDVLTYFRNHEIINDFQDRLNRVLKNSGLYELGKPSRMKEYLKVIDIDK